MHTALLVLLGVVGGLIILAIFFTILAFVAVFFQSGGRIMPESLVEKLFSPWEKLLDFAEALAYKQQGEEQRVRDINKQEQLKSLRDQVCQLTDERNKLVYLLAEKETEVEKIYAEVDNA